MGLVSITKKKTYCAKAERIKEKKLRNLYFLGYFIASHCISVSLWVKIFIRYYLLLSFQCFLIQPAPVLSFV